MAQQETIPNIGKPVLCRACAHSTLDRESGSPVRQTRDTPTSGHVVVLRNNRHQVWTSAEVQTTV